MNKQSKRKIDPRVGTAKRQQEKKPETEENVHRYNSYYKNSYKFQLEIELFESLFFAFSIFQFKFDYGFFTAQADKTPSPIIFVLFCMHVQFFCLQSIEWIQYESTEISNCSFFFLNVLHYGNSKNMMIGSFKKVETISICKTFNRQTSKLLFFFFLNKRINDNHTFDRK